MSIGFYKNCAIEPLTVWALVPSVCHRGKQIFPVAEFPHDGCLVPSIVERKGKKGGSGGGTRKRE